MNHPVYTTIPTIRDLIQNDGKPGVEYAIVDTGNLLKAQSDGWGETAMRTKVFELKGPKGSAPCKLLSRGNPIPGQTMGVKSILHIDVNVKQKTGLDVKEANNGTPSF
jgi:hypothetical protein